MACRHWITCWCLTGFLFGFCSALRAAERVTLPDFLLRSWDSEDGLPAARVRDLAVTPDGYLWAATGRGLVRFDGARFVTFTTNDTPALGDNRVSSLLVTADGDLWASTDGGTVVRRHNGTFEAAALDSRLPGRFINDLADDGDGGVWIATAGAGLVHYRNGTCEFHAQSNGFPAGAIGRVAVGKRGQLWILVGTPFNYNIWRGESGHWQQVRELEADGGDVAEMFPAPDGGLWVATTARKGSAMGARIFKLKDGQPVMEMSPYPWAQDTFHTQIKTIYEDLSGRLWVGSMGTGVYCFKPGSGWEQLGQGAAFSQILVNCLTSDKDGTLWVGLDGAQVDQVSPRPVTTLHLPTNAAQNTIRMVCTSRDGSLWVGTDGAGVFRYREGTWKQFSQDEGLLNGYVGVIFEDRRTNLWVGTWDGLFLLRGEEFRRALSARSSQLVVRAMYQDAGEDLWVGTSSAVVQLRDLKIINGTNGYLDGQVMTIEQDGSGVIWAAVSGRGLYQLVEGRFERSKSEPWGSLVEITALLPDADGGMWLGSLYNGLAYTKDGASRTWTTRDGLPSDGIRALVEDSEGNLWCSSDNGIFGCPKSRLLNYQPGQGPPILFWQLSVADGLDTRRCSGQGQPVAARSVDGRLWFPNWRALAVFDPACVPQSRAVRPPLVEETIVDGTAASPAADGVVRVKSAARSYEFHYSSPTFSSPERLRFRYRLQGWDRDWTEAGQRRVAFYNHLAPGRYEFHVAVGGADGAWHEVVQGHQLEVMPHFLERRSVQVAGALVLLVTGAAIVWAVARVRLQRRLAQIESAQAMERERRRIARDLHDDLGAGLAEVVLLGEVARQNNVPADELQAHVSDMTEKSRRLVTAMDEIVWTVNPRNDSIPNLTSYVAEHARKFFAPTSIHCRLDIPPELPSLPLPAAVRHSLFLAIKEALHNVVKHSAAREVWLRMHWAAGEFTIQVQDDGRGFALNEQSEGRDGLTNLRQRLESVGGRADITSSPGQGTAVKLTLPVIGMNGGA